MPSGIYKRTKGINCGLPTQGFQKDHIFGIRFQKGHHSKTEFQKGSSGFTGTHTKETKEKQRQATLKRFKEGMPEETKEKIQKGNFGKHSGSKNGMWKGGKYQNKQGRWFINIRPNYRISQSRYIAESCLERPLRKEETIHHVNEDKSDDRPENLYVFSLTSKHTKYHHSNNKSILISNIMKRDKLK